MKENRHKALALQGISRLSLVVSPAARFAEGLLRGCNRVMNRRNSWGAGAGIVPVFISLFFCCQLAAAATRHSRSQGVTLIEDGVSLVKGDRPPG